MITHKVKFWQTKGKWKKFVKISYKRLRNTEEVCAFIYEVNRGISYDNVISVCSDANNPGGFIVFYREYEEHESV